MTALTFATALEQFNAEFAPVRTTEPRIVTSHDYPPIPIRTMDWSAHYDGHEESGPYGHGRTEAEAIVDLRDNYDAPETAPAPVRIPPIADFAREIERDVSVMELQRDEFFARVAKLAAELPCPTISTITYAGEYLNDYVLRHCTEQEFSDAQVNEWAVVLMAECPEFSNEFAHFYKDGILAQMDDERAERGRVWPKSDEMDGEL